MSKSDYTRREFIRTLGLTTAALTVSSKFNFRNITPAARPNLLFIITDDHTAQAISAYGSRINKTPNIDRIAGEGARFNNAFCTNSICAPSRASILTGKYSHKNGVTDNRQVFNAGQPTFPRLLQQAGYQTAVIGKWHLHSDPKGFDYWNIFPGQGQYYNPDLIEMGTEKRYHGYATDLITDMSLNWLKNRNDKKPFCLLYQHKAPHRNWMPPPKYLDKYKDVEIPLPETFWDDYSTRSAAAKEQEMRVADHLVYGFDLKLDPKLDTDENLREMWINTYARFDDQQKKIWDDAYREENEAFYRANLKGRELAEWKYQRYMKDYLRCVDSVDENIGRVLDYLDDNGLSENTIVVYTSDQGFYLGEHGWFDKRFMHEESLHMPLLIRYPDRIRKGLVNDDMILNIDFAPLFLDYTGLEKPPEMQGESFSGLIDGTEKNWRDAVYYQYYEYPAWHMVKKHYGIRTKRYKLIHFYYDIDAWELYDLEKDPHELNNIYDDPLNAPLVNELKHRMSELQKKYGDMQE